MRVLLCLTATALAVCSACSSHLGVTIDASHDASNDGGALGSIQ